MMWESIRLAAFLPLLFACSPPVKEGSNLVASDAVGADNEALPSVGNPPQQCSRDTVQKGESYFVPSKADVDKFEAELSAVLSSGGQGQPLGYDYFKAMQWPNGDGYIPSLKTDWSRNFMGIVRGGRRIIYGDYQPAYPEHQGQIVRGMWGFGVVCDGGPPFFGAEYDVETGRVTITGFNGSG